MKLVDILARELNVWPDACSSICQSFSDTRIFFGCGSQPIDMSIQASDHYDSVVTRAEWQAAVDALKVVEWDGVGSPAPGSSIEYSIGDAWYPCEVRYVLNRDDCPGIALVAWCEHLGKDQYLSNDRHHKFRPIRTAEQVAAEEREVEDNEVMSRYMSLSDCEKGILGHSPERAIIGLMRLMGYRKEPKPCGS